MQPERTVVEIKDLIKIYGPNREKCLDLVRSGASQQEVAKAGGLLALKNINLLIQGGKICVIMGLSGSGKSTLLRCINRLVDPTDGQVLVDGVDVVRMPIRDLRRLRAQKMGMVFQHFALFPHMSVVDNVAFGLRIMGVEKAARRQRASKVLGLVGLKGWGEHKPRELSGGMRQRVGLARALVMDTPILLMDEPFSALDPIIRDELQQELLRLQGELSKTIIFVTHDPNEAVTLGDHIVILRQGEIVQQGTPQQIMQSPANNYVANFMRGVGLLKVLTAGQLIDPECRPIDLAYSKTLPPPRNASDHFVAVVEPDGKLVGVVDRRTSGAAKHAAASVTCLKGVAQDFIALAADQPIAPHVPDLVNGRRCLVVIDRDGRYLGMVSSSAFLRSFETDPAVTAGTAKGRQLEQ